MPNIPVPLAAATLLAATAGIAPAAGEDAGPRYRAAQLLIQQRVVIRVQRDDPAPAERRVPTWSEKKGPKCIAIDALAGASFVRDNTIDLVLTGGERMRARLERECPTLNFYSGFYLKPNRDGQVCAGRDPVRSRAGGACGIDSFRRLVPKR